MTAQVLPIVAVMLCVAMALATWRLLRGPRMADRVLALETLYTNVLALLVVLGLRDGSQLYFEAALVVALLGFVGTAAFAMFMLRGDLLE